MNNCSATRFLHEFLQIQREKHHSRFLIVDAKLDMPVINLFPGGWQVGLILYETLRLFTIAPTLWRMANKDLQLGDLFIPKGLGLEIAVHEIHRDPKLWGDDAMTFNPGRFANGVANACTHPLAFMPFSYGPRYCIGQNFALMEAKIVVAMVLQRFQVSLSPNYRHHPDFILVQRPKYGMQVILKTLSSSS